MNANPIIVALDVESAVDARKLVAALDGVVSFYKVGLELYAAEGMPFVKELIERGNQVFLDLKLYDISETVKRATARVAATGVQFLTVHGIKPVMRAAVEGRDGSPLQLLAVTVLTNFDENDLADLGYTCTVADLVGRRVRQAREAGIDGIVCSALEAANVRALAGPDAVIVTPGVRSRTASAGDQKRVTTPAEAIAAGANYLVIGRQITRASDPEAEARRVLEELGIS